MGTPADPASMLEKGTSHVSFDGADDSHNPMNWRLPKKRWTTGIYGFTTMAAAFASSVYTPTIQVIAHEFNTSEEIATLGLSLFLFGLAFGPLLWAPLSEAYGRKIGILVPYFLGMVFTFANAASKDLQTLLITRFFAGFFLSAPMVNTGGVMGDIWAPQQRGKAMVGYAMAIVVGPLLGPIVGAAIVLNTTWRWVFLVTGILLITAFFTNLIFVSESHADTILAKRARKLRVRSGDWSLHTTAEEDISSWSDLARRHLFQPLILLTTPICAFMALYASFVYGILYLTFAAFPISFSETRGWNLLVGSLPFLAILIGIIIANVITFSNQKFYIKQMKANQGRPVPEARLVPMMIGAPIFAAGLFIFGWTSPRDIPWIAPCIGAVLIGLGFFTVFQSVNTYLIDTFKMHAASALAANTLLRSIFGGVFPLFARAMFQNLGVAWAASTLGFIAVAMIPIPYLFYFFGARIRAQSSLIPNGPPPGKGPPSGQGPRGPPGQGPRGPPGQGPPSGRGQRGPDPMNPGPLPQSKAETKD